MSTAERIYRLLLRLYPAGHRQAYGEQMLQQARDLERDARQIGGRQLPILYVRLVLDGIRNAGIEHLEAAMANKRFQPASWLTVGLAAIPGVLVVLSRRTTDQLGVPLAIFSRLYLVLLVVGGLYIWVRQR